MARARKATGPAARRHAVFLVETLGPDLVEGGRKYTGKDVIACGRLMLSGKKDPKFARYLIGTLIPDLRESGQMSTAADLARCARAIDGPIKKRRR